MDVVGLGVYLIATHYIARALIVFDGHGFAQVRRTFDPASYARMSDVAYTVVGAALRNWLLSFRETSRALPQIAASQARTKSLANLEESKMAGELPTDPNSVALMVIALIVLAVTVYAVRRMRPEKPHKNAEIARIYEEVLTTGGGTFCMIMLVLHQIGALFSFLKTSSVIHETALAAIWIGGNVLWGLGVALGRRRIYIVTRQAPPVEPG